MIGHSISFTVASVTRQQQSLRSNKHNRMIFGRVLPERRPKRRSLQTASVVKRCERSCRALAVRRSKLINDGDECEWSLYSARACPNRIFKRSSGLLSIARRIDAWHNSDHLQKGLSQRLIYIKKACVCALALHACMCCHVLIRLERPT